VKRQHRRHRGEKTEQRQHCDGSRHGHAALLHDSKRSTASMWRRAAAAARPVAAGMVSERLKFLSPGGNSALASAATTLSELNLYAALRAAL